MQQLPVLSTYLGHARLRHTQVYLSMTPELLHEAALSNAMQEETTMNDADALLGPWLQRFLEQHCPISPM